jgi:hypothetical protein
VTQCGFVDALQAADADILGHFSHAFQQAVLVLGFRSAREGEGDPLLGGADDRQDVLPLECRDTVADQLRGVGGTFFHRRPYCRHDIAVLR